MPSPKDEILNTITLLLKYNCLITIPKLYGYLTVQVSSSQFFKYLQELLLENKIVIKDNFIVTKNTQNIDTESLANEFTLKLNLTNSFVAIVCNIPWVSMLAITGSCADTYAKKSDDVDFFVITKPGTLFIVRFFVTALSYFYNVKRNRGVKICANKACFNLWLDGSDLKIDKFLQTNFAAREAANMKIVKNWGGVYQTFLQQNDWIFNTLPNLSKCNVDEAKINNKKNKVIAFFNVLFYIPQIVFIKFRQKNEYITKTQLWFHNINRES